MIWKGFRFGLLLQIAIGPVCLFILQSAARGGFLAAWSGVWSVTVIDALYILAAILGLAALVGRKRVKPLLKAFGTAVLLLFGLSMTLSPFHISLIPGIKVDALVTGRSVFLQALMLTAANPMTILFWAGVFGEKIAGEDKHAGSVYLFGLGAVLSTFGFLTVIAGIGSMTSSFLPESVISWINAAVGLLLLFFALKPYLQKRNASDG